MQELDLRCHPDTPARAIHRVRARFLPSGYVPTVVEYRVFADGELALPAVEHAERRDGLWRTTCFEMFVRSDDQDQYWEFNFSPSRCWAAYSFDTYRKGAAELPLAPPRITSWVDVTGYALRVELDVIAPWASASRTGLSAVIEEADGTKSFWALAHPPGRPDFHHRDCFALELPPLLLP